MRKRLLIDAVLIVATVGVTLAAARHNPTTETGPSSSPARAPASTNTAALDDGDEVTTGLFRSIAKRENPLVVAITTQSRVKRPDMKQLFGGNDFFQQFFGAPDQNQPREEIQQALGSGFLISESGEIVTNNHVVAGAEKIRVALLSDSSRNDSSRTYAADIVGRDPLTDSALIKLKDAPEHLPTAVLGDSNAIAPGDWVMAIGNPFQLGHTVTVGVISYKGRPFATTEGRFQNMLQTDASINPGNSGGPLINVRGEVIGVNSAILSGGGNGGNIGIGFAIPINTLKSLLPQLRKGSVQRGRLGVQVLSAPITQDEAGHLGLPKAQGAIVSQVEPDSPADHAGIHAGDVIVEYNGKAIDDAEHLTAMVVETPPNTKVPIVFYHNGQQSTATATVERLELEGADQQKEKENGSTTGFGLSLADVTSAIADQLRLPAGVHGALIASVEPGTAGANAGLQRGDVILEVNRQPVHTAGEASRQLAGIKSRDTAFVLLWRQGVQQLVELRKE